MSPLNPWACINASSPRLFMSDILSVTKNQLQRSNATARELDGKSQGSCSASINPLGHAHCPVLYSEDGWQTVGCPAARKTKMCHYDVPDSVLPSWCLSSSSFFGETAILFLSILCSQTLKHWQRPWYSSIYREGLFSKHCVKFFARVAPISSYQVPSSVLVMKLCHMTRSHCLQWGPQNTETAHS